MTGSRQVSSTAAPSGELMGESTAEESPVLAGAYYQISQLNTQLAHLYTELTMSRTEAQQLKAQLQRPSEETAVGAAQGAEEKQQQAQRIADLISDIRHLQLDLEYHQQKLDQLLDEKQQLMKELKKSHSELTEAKRVLQERTQSLKHRDVDLEHLQQELRDPRNSKDMDEGMLSALRTEAVSKDSALIVSHYELHKEKLMRDRLEQKSLKLMERMQKLMMVVETMRKDNAILERTLVAKERLCEEREAQLRNITQKARQLTLKAKGGKSGSLTHRGTGHKGSTTMLELEGSVQGLPPLRTLDSGGRRSGRSTPRTPVGPTSPYTSRQF